ncbi:MAG: hypothetical protein EOP49_29165 [Sphingobacteriales bacterium]|nr:MAG: hypothetical protein EOP49_29165 [Sphingobacteriales bacterium]
MQVQSGNIGGEHAKRQFALTKNMYNPLNLLLVGRAEVYAAISAIADRPLAGHGSWAVDPGGKYTFIAYQLHGEDDKFVSDMRNMEGELIIPSHSVIFGAWMTAGILGLLAILYIIYLFYKNAFGLLRQAEVLASPYFPIVILYLITGAWIFLFSPLPHIKQTLPIMIAFIVVTHRRMTNS